jgi:hypothetical protein
MIHRALIIEHPTCKSVIQLLQEKETSDNDNNSLVRGHESTDDICDEKDISRDIYFVQIYNVYMSLHIYTVRM